MKEVYDYRIGVRARDTSNERLPDYMESKQALHSSVVGSKPLSRSVAARYFRLTHRRPREFVILRLLGPTKIGHVGAERQALIGFK